MLALPFILQGLSMRGSLMGGWQNSLAAIPELVAGYMERGTPDPSILVTRDITLQGINQAFADLSSPDNQDLRIRINYADTS